MREELRDLMKTASSFVEGVERKLEFHSSCSFGEFTLVQEKGEWIFRCGPIGSAGHHPTKEKAVLEEIVAMEGNYGRVYLSDGTLITRDNYKYYI